MIVELLALIALAGHQQMEGLSKEMQALVTALQQGDQAQTDLLVDRVIAVRTMRLPGESVTTPITNAQLLKTTKGCEIRETRLVEPNLDDVTEAGEIVWDCVANGARPAIVAQTRLQQRGNKFDVHVVALPAGLPSIATPVVGPERGSK